MISNLMVPAVAVTGLLVICQPSMAACPPLDEKEKAQLRDVASVAALYETASGGIFRRIRQAVAAGSVMQRNGDLYISNAYLDAREEVACILPALEDSPFGLWLWSLADRQDFLADFPGFLIDYSVHADVDSLPKFENEFMKYALSVGIRRRLHAVFESDPLPQCDGTSEVLGYITFRSGLRGPYGSSIRDFPLRRCSPDRTIWVWEPSSRLWERLTIESATLLVQRIDAEYSSLTESDVLNLSRGGDL